MSWITAILQLYSQVADLFGNVIVKRINIRLFDLFARFHFILNLPRMCSTCLILVTVSVISWRKPSDSSQKSLSCKTDVFIGKDCEKSLKY